MLTCARFLLLIDVRVAPVGLGDCTIPSGGKGNVPPREGTNPPVVDRAVAKVGRVLCPEWRP